MTDAWLPFDEEAHREWADAADWVRGGESGAAFRREVADAFDDARTWVDPNGYRLSDRIWNAREADRRAIDNVLRQMIANGTDAIEAAKQVEAYLLPTARNTTVTPRGGKGLYSARRLTRTEMTRAYGAATIQAGTVNPFVQGIKWTLSGRHPEADGCDPNAAEDQFGLGEGVYPPDQVPRYPAHPHCFPGGTPVTTADGPVAIEAVRIGQEVLTHEGRLRRVTALHWRDHDGPMVLVRGEHGELLASPEHPVLTQRGWVEAACLQPGDHLCRATGGIRHDAFVGEVQNLPSRFAQFLVAHGIGAVGMPPHAVAFDDQTGGGDDQVRPAASDPVAMLGHDPGIGQRPLHDPLDAGAAVRPGHAGVQMLDLAGGDPATQRLGHLGANFRPSGGIVRPLGGADLGAGLGSLGRVVVAAEVTGGVDGSEHGRRGGASVVRAVPRQGDAFRDGPHRDAEPAEQVAQHPVGHAGGGADGGGAKALVQVHAPQDGLGILPELGGDPGDVAGLRFFSAVSHVSIVPRWSGRLWNLEVADDHTYAVAGVVVHNCLCTLSQVTVDDEAALAQIIQEMRDARAAVRGVVNEPAPAVPFANGGEARGWLGERGIRVVGENRIDADRARSLKAVQDGPQVREDIVKNVASAIRRVETLLGRRLNIDAVVLGRQSPSLRGVAQAIPYNPVDGRGAVVQFNLDHPFWRGDRRVSELVNIRGPEDAAIHELGHVIDLELTGPTLPREASRSGSAWDEAITRAIQRNLTDDEAAIARRISGYADLDRGEFIAETFTSLVRGDAVDDEVLALYRRFNGPEVFR